MSSNARAVECQDGIRELAIVGAGPHALACLCRLLETHSKQYTDHDLTTKRKYYQELDDNNEAIDYVVIDPAGKWLARWHDSFEQMKIKWLRSPVIAHPDSSEDSALLSFASANARERELLPIDDLFFRTGNETKTSNSRVTEHRSRKAKQVEAFNQHEEKFFRRPSTPLFRDFCDALIERHGLGDKVMKAAVTHIEPIFEDASAHVASDTESSDESSESDEDAFQKPAYFRLDLSTGETICARRVLLATGLMQANVPDWAVEALKTVRTLPASICHSDDLWITGSSAPLLRGRKIIIVGSGLSSGHLALTALSYNASKVVLVARKQLRSKQFDIDLSWSGRYKSYQLSKFWQTNNWEKRVAMIREARGGGTLAPDILKEVRSSAEQDPERLEILENSEIEAIESVPSSDDPNRKAWRVTYKNSTRVEECDYIWLATGRKRDVVNEPLFRDIYKHFPIPVAGGLPAVDIDLRWRRGVEVYVTGAYSSLQLGPEALNLSGAKAASERIYTGILGGIDGDENIFSILGDCNS